MDGFESEYKLGIRYLHGIKVLIDLEKALFYIENSANNGFIPAQVSLAFMYLDGVGISKNKQKAYILFKVTADEDYHNTALMMTGLMLEYGEGVRENIKKSLKYYKLAAKQGNIYAQNKLMCLGEISET